MSEKLILWKPRPQRLAEAFLAPLVILPVGPAMRGLFGGNASIFCGLAVAFPLMILATIAGRRWALGHGGEWVTGAERLRRMIAEIQTHSIWQTCVANFATYAITLFSVFLIITPLSRFGEVFGGPAITLGIIAAVSLTATIPTLTARYRRLDTIIIADGEPPPRHTALELRKNLPRAYLAALVGSAAGILVGLQVHGGSRFASYAVVSIVVSRLLRSLFAKRPNTLYASQAVSRLGSHLVLGILCWGIPFAIFFSGFSVLALPRATALIAIVIGTAVMVSILGGVLMGFWSFTLSRLENRRRNVALG